MTFLEAVTPIPGAEVFVNWAEQALWQGALLGILLVMGLRYVPVQRARLRYLMALTVLSSLTIFPLASATWTFLTEHIAFFSNHNTATTIIRAPGNSNLWFRTAEQTQIGTVLGSLMRPLPWQSIVLSLYLVGVSVLILKLVAQLLYIRRLRRNVVPASDILSARLRTLASAAGVPSIPFLAFSSKVDTALVLGWRKPLILLPTRVSSRLTSMQLDSVLAHELAHIKRRDYLVNLLQCLVEILFFYHPAVWWASASARREREGCCDDLAVQICGRRSVYIEALIALERQRAQTPLALAVGHGDLTVRVQRLLGNRVFYAYSLRLLLRLGLALLLGIGVGSAQEGTTFFKRQLSDNEISSSFSTITYGDGFEIVAAESLERLPTENIAQSDLPFDLYLPTNLPKGFVLSEDFIILQPQNLVLTPYSVSLQTGVENALLLQQQPLATFQGQPVGASARVKHVLVGGNSGEYVEGHWSSNEAQSLPKDETKVESSSSRSTDEWTNGGTTQMLVWQQDGFVFTLRSNRPDNEINGSKQLAIIQIAKSLTPITLRP